MGVLQLSEEQREIAVLPPATKLLVTAGPGTGKTHALIARLAELVGTYDLSPGQEVLVLSFSRAAVREIRNRVAAAGGDVAYVRAVTFDSFATRLLAELQPEGPWIEENYDGRIARATKLIREDERARQELEAYAHLLVDEVQDLVGERADFVRTIVQVVSGGFTLLGDPAQGIYNFQAEGKAREIGAAALYEWLRRQFGERLIEQSLSHNFRAQTDDSRVALWAGRELNGAAPKYSEIRDNLIKDLLNLPSVGALDNAIAVLRRSRGRTAVLCRTNGEALVISGRLHEVGVDHWLQRTATDRAIAPWVGTILGDVDHRHLGRTAFFDRIKESDPPHAPPAETAWKLMKRIDSRRSDDIDLEVIATRFRTGFVPDELSDVPPPDLMVSTIHRAKGLEFDRVLLVAPTDLYDEDPQAEAEEARVLYVAMTRPRRDLISMDAAPVDGRLRKADTDRWVRRGWKNWQVWGYEVSGDDTDKSNPPGGLLLDCNPRDVQNYLRSEVRPGDSVALRLISSSVSGSRRAFYAIEHEGHDIGLTSERFSQLLYRTLRINRRFEPQWPVAIRGLHIESIDTVAATGTTTRRCGLGVSGIWLRPRVVGLGDLVWARSKSDALPRPTTESARPSRGSRRSKTATYQEFADSYAAVPFGSRTRSAVNDKLVAAGLRSLTRAEWNVYKTRFKEGGR
jgi:hypothetical protein